jgi:FtsH-binding integral membrane protein
VATFEIVEKGEKKAIGAAALLGSGLALTWMFGLGYHATSWLNWTVCASAVVALAGLGPAATSEMSGIGTWPLVAMVLLAGWLFGLAANATRWLTWLSFAFGCAFLILSVAFTTASSHLELRRRRPLHGRA